MPPVHAPLAISFRFAKHDGASPPALILRLWTPSATLPSLAKTVSPSRSPLNPMDTLNPLPAWRRERLTSTGLADSLGENDSMATVFADLATANSAFAKCWSLGLLTEHDATRGKKTTKTTHG